jgi:hypothetical protein
MASQPYITKLPREGSTKVSRSVDIEVSEKLQVPDQDVGRLIMPDDT